MISLVPFRTFSNWSGTIFRRFLQQTGSSSFTIFFDSGTAKQGDARNANVIMERNSKLDKADQVAVIEEKLTYLLLALENYAKALIKSDKHDLKMYRWISLWFANTEEKRVNQMVETFVQTIPDHKFVGLLYQLCARMVTNKDSKFPILLKYIILKCAKKHPYHTLPIILALANSDADEKVFIFFVYFFQFYILYFSIFKYDVRATALLRIKILLLPSFH